MGIDKPHDATGLAFQVSAAPLLPIFQLTASARNQKCVYNYSPNRAETPYRVVFVEGFAGMRIKYAAAVLAVAASITMLLSASADAVTDRQKRDCKADYNRYCKKYELGTEGLRACMSRSIKRVSNRCISALVAGGDMSKAQADRVRRQKAAARR
jgi:hypothetical protein